MILGLSLLLFTYLHVFLSLVGIFAGLVVIAGLIDGRMLRLVTALFLVSTVLTSVTGFLFPFKGVTPGIILGVLSLIALLLAIIALYGAKLAGVWRGVYVINVCIATWFNVFVLFAQLFAKVPALKAIAPTQSSPAFGVTQLVVLLIFILLTIRALKGFKAAS
jgi:hypothetical protein